LGLMASRISMPCISRKHDDAVQFCAFQILAEGGDDLRKLPLSMRRTNLERLLARRPAVVFVNPFERGEIGPDLFRAACSMGLEGLVSKRVGIDLIRLADRSIGSRSRTGSIRRWTR
jgi:ATP-dependent DNA ligase